jgi:putative peptidoglycan lipid II flippase
MLPVSLFGMSVSAAELAAMSGERGTTAEIAAAVRSRLERGLGRIAYFVIPSAAAFLCIGGVLAGALFEGGAFTRTDAQWVWGALGGAAVGLLASTMGRLYSSASYALGDTRTPLRAALVRVMLGGLCGWIAALHLPRALGLDARWGVAALTAVSGLAAWLEYSMLRRALASRVGDAGLPGSLAAGLWACALAAGGGSASAAWFLAGRHALVMAAVAVPLFGVIYLGLTRLTGMDRARRA